MPYEKELITTRLKLKDVYPDLEGYDADAEFIRKGIVPADLDIKEDERAIISYITTGAKDRDNEIVLPSGADLKDYRKNPVVLFGHNYSALPIGKNMWIKSDDRGLIAKTQYANHDEADKVYNYRKDGFPLAESIGFIPIEYKTPTYKDGQAIWDKNDLEYMGLSLKDLKGVRVVYTKWTMLEYSDVAVPSNPEAMQLAKSKGLFVSLKEKELTDDLINGNGETLSSGSLAIKHATDCTCDACVNARINLENAKSKQNSADSFKSINDSIDKLKEETRVLQEERAYSEIKSSEIAKHAASVFAGLRDETNLLMEEVKSLREEKQLNAEKDVVALPSVIQDVFDTLTESLKEVTNAVKVLQDDKVKEKHEEDYYTFDYKSEAKKIDYKSIIKESVKSAIEENRTKTLREIKTVAKDTLSKMKGKVVK